MQSAKFSTALCKDQFTETLGITKLVIFDDF
jgi:hypothetical protein